MKFFSKITLVFLTSLLIMGCQSNDPGKGHGSENGESQFSEEGAFFSERPEKPTGSFMTIVRLQHPALLKSATVLEGQIRLDPKAVEAVEAEQKEAISKMKQISPQAKILYRYRLSLNAIAIVASVEHASAIEKLSVVKQIARDEFFDRPAIADIVIPTISNSELQKRNSTSFIGAHTVRKTLVADGHPVDGRGVRVGIIDTGIDYTHAMLGGSGLVSDYEAIDPDKETEHFPNRKVVGGIDLVGSGFNITSPDPEARTPKPDGNPIDKSGHGTHVAGTVAGLGDGVNTYDGVAPGAELYSIKVFGDKGGVYGRHRCYCCT
ncbi:S8 family serine peptidase [Bdellovibrionales bacterium]|nr:S8 family serine peptidase [Bdellovibrionales bacterium]